MIERDYLMRMIDVLVRVLARVVFHKEAYEYPQALAEIDNACKSLVGMGSSLLRNFADTQLIEMFERDPETSGPKCYILGILLSEEADILRAQGIQDESLMQYMKSLSLLLTALLDIGAPAEPKHISIIDQTMELLRPFELPQHVKEKVFGYYEFTGNFGKAEDILFELVGSDTRYTQMGERFYERLLSKSDDELIKGGLPRDEVHEGIIRLHEMPGGEKVRE